MFFCFFVRQRFLDNPRADSRQSLHTGVLPDVDVSSPLLGVSSHRRAEKGGHKIFVTMGLSGKFLHVGGF